MSRLLSLLFLTSVLLLGQTTYEEQAARLQNINAFLLDLRPAAAPLTVEKSRLEVAFELYPQPDLDTRIGRKDEPIDPPSIVPRLRLRYVMKNGFFAGATAVPGIEYKNYDADTIALEAGYRLQLGETWFQLRGAYSDGEVVGPVTETDALDLFTFTNHSYDLAAARKYGRFRVYGFAGIIDIDTSLDVESDGVHLENTESTWYGGVGAAYQRGRYSLTAEQNFTDDYLRNVIVAVAYHF